MIDSKLYYSVGALLYCPANNKTIADSIICEHFGKQFSLALCLEDTINDQFLLEAETILIQTLQKFIRQVSQIHFLYPKSL